MSIQLAECDSQILKCFPIISQLRLHLEESKFVEQVWYQMKEGYQLAFLEVEGQTIAVAGFRISTCLALGKFLYIDDLVVDEVKRSALSSSASLLLSETLRQRDASPHGEAAPTRTLSNGYGKQLFEWLIEYARKHNCQHLSLDSGVQRFDAHRFYLMQRMNITSHHFSIKLKHD